LRPKKNRYRENGGALCEGRQNRRRAINTFIAIIRSGKGSSGYDVSDTLEASRDYLGKPDPQVIADARGVTGDG
jgi:hypothetical protein